MVRLEMLKLSRMWDDKPGVAQRWECIKARQSYETAITNWLRPEDIARYEKITDPRVNVSKKLAEGPGGETKISGEGLESTEGRVDQLGPRCLNKDFYRIHA